MQFTKFPLLVQFQILEKLTPQELFFMSFTSTAVRNAIRHSIFRSKKIEFLLYTRGKRIELIFTINGQELELQFLLPPPQEHLVKAANVVMNGKFYKLREYKDPVDKINKIWCLGDNGEDGKIPLAFEMLEWCVEMFRIPRKINLQLNPKPFKDFKHFMTNLPIRTVRKLVLLADTMTAKKIEEYLEMVHIECGMVGCIRKKIDEDSKMLKMDHFISFHSPWLTVEHLKNFSGKFGIFTEAKLTTDDIVAFVRHWMASGNRTLEVMDVELEKKSSLDPDWIAAAVGARPFDPKQRSEEYEYNSEFGEFHKRHRRHDFDTYLDYPTDIVRSDGMLATIRVSPGSFHFLVWKNRFPRFDNNRSNDVFRKLVWVR